MTRSADETAGTAADRSTATDQTGGGRAIRLSAVRHVYPTAQGDVVALDGVDLTADAGAFVSVVGPSGCGKTTLLQILAGFFPPTSGVVEVGGAPVSGPGPERGVVFQQPTSLYPWLNVSENVALGLRIRGVPKSQRQARALEELERVGLTEFADRAPYELSGGMQQRCQIARVLANDPDVMLMDEPFGAVDALTRERLQVDLNALWRATGRSVLLITHSVDEAVLLGSRVIVMSPRPGRIVLDLPVGFAASGAALADVRSDPEFASTTHRVREAIVDQIH